MEAPIPLYHVALKRQTRGTIFATPYRKDGSALISNLAFLFLTKSCRKLEAFSRGAIIVSSSPEILCRVDGSRVVTNRPLAGTRRRGRNAEVCVLYVNEAPAVVYKGAHGYQPPVGRCTAFSAKVHAY
eukprot:1158836-Pelagomonas_calceolata.AAC.8